MNIRWVRRFKQELKGALYVQVLRTSLECCENMLLVTRKTVTLSQTIPDFLSLLEQWLISSTLTDRWPGTTLLFGGKANVHRYRWTSQCQRTLLQYSDGLYDWRQPALPEDLCLIRADGDPWLITIAHEKDAYLKVTDDELSALLDDLPDLSSLLDLTRKYE